MYSCTESGACSAIPSYNLKQVIQDFNIQHKTFLCGDFSKGRFHPSSDLWVSLVQFVCKLFCVSFIITCTNKVNLQLKWTIHFIPQRESNSVNLLGGGDKTKKCVHIKIYTCHCKAIHIWNDLLRSYLVQPDTRLVILYSSVIWKEEFREWDLRRRITLCSKPREDVFVTV